MRGVWKANKWAEYARVECHRLTVDRKNASPRRLVGENMRGQPDEVEGKVAPFSVVNAGLRWSSRMAGSSKYDS